MSPENPSTITDSRSEKIARRGRPPFPRELVLAAADRLFLGASEPGTVSMDDVAAAAGVGKGTLFRAFTSRRNLINQVFEARVAPIRAAVDDGPPPLGPGGEPGARTVAILNALLRFKSENAYLCRELEVGGLDLHELDYYRWLGATLRAEITAATGEADPLRLTVLTQALTSTLRPDLYEQALADGVALEALLAAQAELVERILG